MSVSISGYPENGPHSAQKAHLPFLRRSQSKKARGREELWGSTQALVILNSESSKATLLESKNKNIEVEISITDQAL